MLAPLIIHKGKRQKEKGTVTVIGYSQWLFLWKFAPTFDEEGGLNAMVV